MNWKKWVRQLHRWLSIGFTAGVLTYIVIMSHGRPATWVGLLALLPLVALVITGLYLFALPYAALCRAALSPGGLGGAASLPPPSLP